MRVGDRHTQCFWAEGTDSLRGLEAEDGRVPGTVQGHRGFPSARKVMGQGWRLQSQPPERRITVIITSCWASDLRKQKEGCDPGMQMVTHLACHLPRP